MLRERQRSLPKPPALYAQSDCPDGNYIALNNSLAPGGYAYLLIHQGRGTLASCMFSGFKQQAEYVARTAAFFAEATGLICAMPARLAGSAI